MVKSLIPKIVIEVEVATQIENDILVKAKCLSGKVDIGIILQANNSNLKWRVESLAYISPETMHSEREIFLMKGLNTMSVPSRGMQLVSVR